jgi:hypothetical protein
MINVQYVKIILQNNNFELSITKRKTKVYAHKTCIEKSSKNGTRNRR